MKGWFIRSFEAVGKTEVLCEDHDALLKLKEAAAAIPSSDIFPSFNPSYPHSLFFFDVRPEFVEWLGQYAAAAPLVKSTPKTVGTTRERRAFSSTDMVFAALALVFVFTLFAKALPYFESAASPAPIPRTVEAVKDEPEEIQIIFLKDTSVAKTDSPSLKEPRITVVDTKATPSGGGRELVIWFLDVGQGDGIAMRLPNGRFVVIDCNAGSGEKMAELLSRNGCREIYAMIMTHPHMDHIGGLSDVLRKFPVKNFYDPAFGHRTNLYTRVLEAVERNGADYIVPRPGERLDWDPALKVMVLNAGTTDKDPNNSSIVLHLSYSNASIVFTGDAEDVAEREMVEKFRGRMRAEVLKAGHHGSKTSTTPEFLAEIQPRYAIISCGVGNNYGHPAPKTLRLLEESGIKIFRTDLQGTVTAVSTGGPFRFTSERP